MPPAARITDMHTCPMVNPGPTPHVGGPVSSGCPTVIIGYKPAARVGDTAVCVPARDAIAAGSPNVRIGYKNAARVGDPTVHGGVIVVGCPSVNIGSTPQAFTLTAAAASGAPFCEECEKARKEAEREEELAEPPPENEPPADSVVLEMKSAPGAAPPPALPPALPASGLSTATPYAPTDDERALAAAEGNSLEQRAAREKVIRDFYERYKDDGLGQERADQDMGVGGKPPRPNGSPVGYGIDLSKPVKVISFPPPETMDQYVRHHGNPGNFFDPLGGQSGDAVGLNADPKHRKLRTWQMPQGEGVQSGNGPIIDAWTDAQNPLKTNGGGVQVTVPTSIKDAVRCECCGQRPCKVP